VELRDEERHRSAAFVDGNLGDSVMGDASTADMRISADEYRALPLIAHTVPAAGRGPLSRPHSMGPLNLDQAEFDSVR
jgi:hypothetical protein